MFDAKEQPHGQQAAGGGGKGGGEVQWKVTMNQNKVCIVLILGDDAVLCIAYAMLIWTPIIPATRWSCSRPPADGKDCSLQLHLIAGTRGAQMNITGLVLSAMSP